MVILDIHMVNSVVCNKKLRLSPFLLPMPDPCLMYALLCDISATFGSRAEIPAEYSTSCSKMSHPEAFFGLRVQEEPYRR